MNGTFQLFTWNGIKFKMHFIMPAFLFFRIFSDRDPLMFRYNLAFAVILFFTIIIHELGHALTAKKLGGQAHEIVLWPLGGLAYTSGHKSLQNQLKVTLGGPLTHIPLALLFAGAATLAEGRFSPMMFTPFYADLPASHFWSAVLMIGVKVQVILFLFNMCVPAYPLDCGHALAELMLLRGKSPETTAKVLVVLSAIAGTVILFYFESLFIGLWIFYETWRLYSLDRAGAIRQHPLFANVLRYGRPRKKSRLSLVKGGRTCPTCGRSVGEKAVMCGFCEKIL